MVKKLNLLFCDERDCRQTVFHSVASFEEWIIKTSKRRKTRFVSGKLINFKDDGSILSEYYPKCFDGVLSDYLPNLK